MAEKWFSSKASVLFTLLWWGPLRCSPVQLRLWHKHHPVVWTPWINDWIKWSVLIYLWNFPDEIVKKWIKKKKSQKAFLFQVLLTLWRSKDFKASTWHDLNIRVNTAYTGGGGEGWEKGVWEEGGSGLGCAAVCEVMYEHGGRGSGGAFLCLGFRIFFSVRGENVRHRGQSDTDRSAELQGALTRTTTTELRWWGSDFVF